MELVQIGKFYLKVLIKLHLVYYLPYSLHFMLLFFNFSLLDPYGSGFLSPWHEVRKTRRLSVNQCFGSVPVFVLLLSHKETKVKRKVASDINRNKVLSF